MPEIPNLQSQQLNQLQNQSIQPLQQNQLPSLNQQKVALPVVQELPKTIIQSQSAGSNAPPITQGLALPIVNTPDPAVNYPVINVPTQEEFDAAVKAEQKKKEGEKEEKSRGLPDSKPVLPQIQIPVQNTQDNRNISDQPSTNSNMGVPVIEVPLVGPVPVPPKEQVILAGTTATASVAAALIGKSLVEWMVKKMKPIVEQLFVRGKKLLSKDLTPYETQVYFAFEKSASLKKVNKLLKKEQKIQKKEQYKRFHEK